MSEGEKRSPEGEGGFRVIDRRRFTAEGLERKPDEGAAEPGAEASGETASSRPGSRPTAAAEERPGPAVPLGEPYDDDVRLAEPTFATLVMSLSTQALVCLGEIPAAPGEPPRRDLPGARSVIDLLGVLEKKTRGNLDPEEAALLERILYDLRLRYVEVARA